MKPVFVVWLDITCENGWVETPDQLTPSRCETVGFLVHETQEYLTVAQSRCQDNGQCNLTCIPTGTILEIFDLTLPLRPQCP